MQEGGGVHIGAGLQPQALDHRQQHLRARGAVDVIVEGVVQFGGRCGCCPSLRRVKAASHSLRERAQPREVRLAADWAWRSAVTSPSIRHAGAGEVVELFAGDDRHAHRAVRQRFQRLFGDQPCQRLAHRHGAGLQLLGQILDAQHLRR